MSLGKVLFFTALLTNFHLFVLGDGRIIFKFGKCYINPEFVYENATCFAKSWSRNVSTANMKLYFKQPITEFFVDITLI